MSTATVDDKAIARARRALEEKLSDARELLHSVQEDIAALSRQLVDPSAEIDQEFADLRQRQRECAAAVSSAADDLAHFNGNNPSAEELQVREREAAAEADRQAKRKVLEQDATDLLTLIEGMDRARDAYASMALRRADSARAIGLLHLDFLLPADFFEMRPGHYSVGGVMPWCGRRPKLIEWLAGNQLPVPEKPAA